MNSIYDQLVHFEYENFDVQTLRIQSKSLKGNRLGDPNVRFNPVLVPKAEEPELGWPLIVNLSGLGSNGSKSFAPKGFEANTTQDIDKAVSEGRAPLAVYVFVDAFTAWGGSQFRDSAASGMYEQYIMNELLPALAENYSIHSEAKFRVVTGASSGGYGALHLSSRYPNVFGVCGALAPDSDFRTSLLPDIYSAAPTLKKLGIKGVRQELQEGRFFRRKDSFKVLNAVAMAHCYSSDKKISSPKSFPICLETGALNKEIWKDWLKKDPVFFLRKRIKKVKVLHKVYIDVGRYDQFNLAFGARKMKSLLEEATAPLVYSEFDGNHFDMAPRRLIFWKWLEQFWR